MPLTERSIRAVSVWDNFEYAGGSRLAVFPRAAVFGANDLIALDGEERCEWEFDRRHPAWDFIVTGYALRNEFDDATWEEWRSIAVDDEHLATSALIGGVEGEGPRYDLGGIDGGLAERIETDGTPTLGWQLNSLDAGSWVDVITSLPGFPVYFTKGIIDSGPDVDLSFDADTYLAALEELAELTELELEIRRDDSARDYKIDFRSARGSSAATVLFAVKRNIVRAKHRTDALQMRTRLYPRGGGSKGSRGQMHDHRWTASAVSSKVVTATSPSAGAPIGFEGMLVWPNLLGDDAAAQQSGLYLYRDKVLIADMGLSVGDALSARCELTVDQGTSTNQRLRVEFFDGADVSLGTEDTTLVSSSTPNVWERSTFANQPIPASTVKVSVSQVWTTTTGGGTPQIRRAMVSKAAVVEPFVETAAYVEADDGTLTEVLYTDAATHDFYLASASHGVSAAEEFRVVRNSSGHGLTYLERPASLRTHGLRSGPLDRPDIPNIDNLALNPYLEDFTAALADNFTKLGGIVTSQNTTTGNYLTGGGSMRCQAASAGDGVEQTITVSPSIAFAYFTGQAQIKIVSGTVLFEVIDVTNGSAIPSVTSATTGPFREFLIQPGVDFNVISTVSITLRVTASGGAAEWYLDAVQLTNLEQAPNGGGLFFKGRAANNLWVETLKALQTIAVVDQMFEFDLIDVHRKDVLTFTEDEVIVGGTVRAKDSDGLGIDLETRIFSRARDLLIAGDSQVELDKRPESMTGILGRRGRRALTPITPNPTVTPLAGGPAGSMDNTYYPNGSSGTALQPAQAAADVTGQNASASSATVGGEIAFDIADATNRALTALTLVGYLGANVLKVDGTNSLVITAGKQSGFAADGASVTFSPAFQNVPEVRFVPAGVYFRPEFAGQTIEDWDGAAISITDTSGSQKETDHTLATTAGDGVYIFDFDVKTLADLEGSRGTLELLVDEDGVSGYTAVKTWSFHPSAAGILADSEEVIPYHGVTWNEADDAMTVTSSGKFRFQLTELKDAGANYEITVTPIRVRWVGAVGELFWATVPDGLSASGFTMRAEIIERDLTLAQEIDAFPAGTITTEGSSLALGGTGLDADAWDNQYNVIYDGTLTINSADSTVAEDDLFPAGLLSAQGEAHLVVLTAQVIDGDYDVIYDRTLEATADGNTPTSDAMSGTRSVTGSFAETNISRNPTAGAFTTFYNVEVSGGGSVTVQVQRNDGGAGWVTERTDVYSTDQDALKSVAWTEAPLIKGDDVRLNISAGSGTYTITAVKNDYDAEYLDISVTVDVDVDKGAGWVNKDSSVYTVTDEDGVKNTNSATGTTKNFVDAALDLGHKVRVWISALTVTGSGTALHTIDPDGVEYTSGTIDTATLECVVAIDAKDGAGGWVEKSTRTHSVTDTTGSGTSLVLTDEGQSFSDAAIDTNDDVRVRLKSIVITGNSDSDSTSIDPQEVNYFKQTGTLTTYSQTPLTGDVIPWVARLEG